MDVVTESSLQVGWLRGAVRPPTPSLTIAVKATFVPRHRDNALLADEQVPLEGQCFDEDDPDLAPRHGGDQALFKPRGECLVTGSVFAPDGTPTTALSAGFSVGSIRRAFVVRGDRSVAPHLGAVPTVAAPFTRMSLSASRAYGGPGFVDNRFGRGRVAVATEEGARIQLPNLEAPGVDPRATGRRPVIQLGPMGASDPRRLRHAGTCDAAWLDERWPHLPDDFSFDYFLTAPEEQRIDGFFRGDEAIEMHHLSPSHPVLVTRLPGLLPRVFLESAALGFREVLLSLDTITLDSDRDRIFLVFRGVLEIDPNLVRRLYLAEDSIAERRPVATHERAMRALLADADHEEREAEGFEPPALSRPAPRVAHVASPHADRGAPARFEHAPSAAAISAPDPSARQIVERARREGLSLAGADLSEGDLTEVDLRGMNLRRAILRRARLSGADLRGACLDGAVLTECELVRADLSRASLVGAELSRARADKARFGEANLDDAYLDDASLVAVDFLASSAERASACGANLTYVRLDRARWRGADLEGATLDDARAIEADLRDVVLERCRAQRLRLDGARVEGLRAEALVAPDASLRGVFGSGSFFEAADLRRATFARSDLAGADFTAARLEGASLDGCRLTKARFERANLAGASAIESDLMAAAFDDAVLTGADFRGSNLFGAELLGAELTDVETHGANVERTKLREAS